MIKRIVKIFLFILLIFGIYINSDPPWCQTSHAVPLPGRSPAEEDTNGHWKPILAMIYGDQRSERTMSCRRVRVAETNTISDNKASIRQGIQTLSDELKEAKKVAS